MILIIDDEAHIRTAVQEILAMAGYLSRAAGSGAEGLEVVRADPDSVRLVLLDLVMPDMDGIAAYGALRAVAPHLPIILSSGYQQAATGTGDDPALTFLQKPYDIDTLLAAVEGALSGAPR